MRKFTLILLSLLVSVVAFGFISDDDPLKKLLAQLEKYRSGYTSEKVHLHFDKPYYAIGDNIWFKAYVLEGEKHQLSGLSKILYVDLINDKDSVKSTLKLPLSAGLAWGEFMLADSLREGNYRVRAYTNWMRNFGEEYFFDKTIAVGNVVSNDVFTTVNYTYSAEGSGQKVVADIHYTDLTGKPIAGKEVSYSVQLDFRNISKGKGITDAAGNIQISFVNTQPFLLKSGKILASVKLDDKNTVNKVFPVKATSSNVDVQFFPEGGDLVTGLRSKVGFKALGSDGLGITVSGYVTDESNTRMADFTSARAGMGAFGLQPTEGHTYTARVRFPDGSEKSFPLPKPKIQGYTLTVNNLDPKSLLVRIGVSPQLIGSGDITLVAQSNGAVQYVSKSTVSSGSLLATVPKERFSTGVLQLTLFSAENEPVAERVVFIDRMDNLGINVSTANPEYIKREKVKMSVQVSDTLGRPVIGSFSVAVTDESKVPFDDEKETTILSNILLTSDLRGFIENPNYYFINKNEETARHLDLLMLTQGWRRFAWKSILTDSYPALSFKPENFMQVSGRVTSAGGKPVVGGKVTLFSSSGDVFLIDTITNAEGRFNFDNLSFRDSTRFVVQARNQKDRKNVEIELDRVPPQLVTRNKNAAAVEINVNRSMAEYLKNSSEQYAELKRAGILNRTIMLEEVKIVEKRSLVNKNSSNLNGPGHADAIVTADMLENSYDLAQYLQGRIAGLIIRNGVPYLTRNMASSFSGPIPMQIIIDGTYVDSESLEFVNVQDVETVEILKSGGNTAIYGIRGGGGVMIITTKRGENKSGYTTYAPGIISHSPKGLNTVREFYSPNYDDPKTDQKSADLRTTIYWNPNVVTDSTGKAQIEFYNADGTGRYRATVEGISINGNLGRTIFKYTVR